MNIEVWKLEGEHWFKRGVGGFRLWEEVQAYLEGLEIGILNAYESLGRSSDAVYKSASAGQEIENHLLELIDARRNRLVNPFLHTS